MIQRNCNLLQYAVAPQHLLFTRFRRRIVMGSIIEHFKNMKEIYHV